MCDAQGSPLLPLCHSITLLLTLTCPRADPVAAPGCMQQPCQQPALHLRSLLDATALAHSLTGHAPPALAHQLAHGCACGCDASLQHSPLQLSPSSSHHALQGRVWWLPGRTHSSYDGSTDAALPLLMLPPPPPPPPPCPHPPQPPAQHPPAEGSSTSISAVISTVCC
jgi:hypothetical protein